MNERPRTMTAERLACIRATHGGDNHVADVFAELDAEIAANDSSEQTIRELAELSISAGQTIQRIEGELAAKDYKCDCGFAEGCELLKERNELRSQIERLKGELAQTRLQVDALMGNDEAVHMGAQAAIETLRQSQNIQAECDWLRRQRDKLRAAMEVATPMIRRERELSDQLAVALKLFPRLWCGCAECKAKEAKIEAALAQHAAMRAPNTTTTLPKP